MFIHGTWNYFHSSEKVRPRCGDGSGVLKSYIDSPSAFSSLVVAQSKIDLQLA